RSSSDLGSSGKLRSVMQLPPPGDLRNVLVAMSDMPKFYEKVFQYRFADSDGALAGHPLGNLIISGIAEMQGSTYNAMQLLTKFFHVTGKIYRSEEHTSELQSRFDLVCRLLLEKKKTTNITLFIDCLLSRAYI